MLTYPKFKLTPDQQHDLLADYLPWTESVPMPTPLPKTPHCRDPSDVPFLQLALAEPADALITGDADLLDLGPLSKLSILASTRAVTVFQD